MTENTRADAPPLYRRVLDVLRRDILAGAPTGARLPTEEALCRRFGVSRHTVREALRRLREEGLVASRQGAGTTVAAPVRAPLYVHDVTSVEELLQYAAETRYEPGSGRLLTARGALADRLGCAAGTRWLRIEGFRFAGAEALPICWTEVFVRAEFGRIAELIGHRPGPVFGWIEEVYGQRMARIEQTLRAVALPATVAAGLGAEPGGTAIEISRAYRTTTGKLAEVSFNLHPAERFTYSITLRRQTEAWAS